MRFLVIVFATTWLFQAPALLAEHGQERFGGLVVLGFFAPLLIALGLSLKDGKRAWRALFAPLGRWRVPLAFYLIALALPCTIFVVSRAAAAAVGGDDLGPWFYPPREAQHFAAMLLIPFTEQIPWRGYLYPRLESKLGPLHASLVTGLAWGLFHVQKHTFIDPNASWPLAALTITFMTAGTLVFSWIYRRTGGSLLLVVIANMGAYLNNPSWALPSLTPLAIYTLGYCVCAAALVTLDRETWSTRSVESTALPST